MKTAARSLYLHIPFCKAKCAYCDFFSVPAEHVPDRYVDALCAEIAFHAEAENLAAPETVYIGGGTPSLLSPAQLERIMFRLDSLYPSGVKPGAACAPEITLEVNPESLCEPFLETALRCGVNRISVGVQALDDGALRCVRRRCSRERALGALSLLSRSGVRFSADMIAGLPELGDTAFVSGLKEVLTYNPEHVSLYALTVEESTPLYRQIERGRLAYTEETTDSQWLAGRALLERAGYAQYEVSNFAKPGCRSRHNTAYWRQRSYAGAGAGAVGTLYDTEAAAAVAITAAAREPAARVKSALRYANTADIAVYTDFWTETAPDPRGFAEGADFPLERELLDADTLAFEFCMLGLRLREGIAAGEYEERFGKKLDTAVFEKWRQKGLAVKYSDCGEIRYALSADGILFLNAFLSELLA
ncbi:coproporphyrinogen-III oxidase family protein [Treponema brennaborense]|uniref:Oxygen-independent coproporphyrinogen III oxidase n=1 Tax=Treponema brennaborense (strain DSM 12168 / CIP 105900 / DD5/3) TaxID=906968 RepID=F4LN65_TREBD|nr:coproporphyrinogen-III oxidase family protein [Treponema brennaborense]AEE16830.1 oxygen-independent coproporphyrinogen III oxidase [Treponema brennaborense DSM 12168]